MQHIHTATLDYIDHPVFVLERDLDGIPRYVAFNSFGCKRLKKPVSDVLGKTAEDLYPGRLGTAAFSHHREAFETAQPRVYEILLPISGTQLLVRTHLRPVLDTNGEVIQVIGCSQDIPGNQSMTDTPTDGQVAGREMEDFINLAAHDLRTPMRQVQQIAQVLREEFADAGAEKLELIDLLADLSDNAMRLISDVLSHAQATNSTQQVIEFDFGELVHDIMTLLDPQKLCGLRCDTAMVHADRTAIQIILRNLIDNAIKYAKTPTEGQPAPNTAEPLQLEIVVGRAPGGGIRIMVRDNGVGFGDPALLFLNGGTLRTDSGFGLLGIRRLIHARGGNMTVTDRPDTTGAEISFSLPGDILKTSPDHAAEKTHRRTG